MGSSYISCLSLHALPKSPHRQTVVNKRLKLLVPACIANRVSLFDESELPPFHSVVSFTLVRYQYSPFSPRPYITPAVLLISIASTLTLHHPAAPSFSEKTHSLRFGHKICPPIYVDLVVFPHISVWQCFYIDLQTP